jgi:KaiC/GvpD/RAD55 family RecA-like ATPase
MDYRLAIDTTPETVPAGTAILLVHPSTGETDRIDTDFLSTDTDRMLVVSTRTTAREVRQKLEHYEVDESRATILDALSVDRGYTRRQAENVRYVSAPDDLEGIVDEIEVFLESTEGKRRISVDSITEMIYYTDVDHVTQAVDAILALLEDNEAVGLFHLAKGVLDDETVDIFRERFDGVVDLSEDGTVSSEF